MKGLRRILRVPWTAHHTNLSILEETDSKMGFMSSIKKRKLTFLGHVLRKPGDCLEKTVIEGSICGKRGRGRPRKSWLDDAMEWTGLSLNELIRSVENRVQYTLLATKVGPLRIMP